jgi:hypothetical protein
MRLRIFTFIFAVLVVLCSSSCKKCYTCVKGKESTGSICTGEAPGNEDIDNWVKRLEQQAYVCTQD